MRKPIHALVASVVIACAAPATVAGQPMTDAELAAVSGAGVMDPVMTMMANMMVVLSGAPVVGPIHQNMMAAMNRLPVLGPLHLRIMAHATMGSGAMEHTL